jgi:hypothetical protein
VALVAAVVLLPASSAGADASVTVSDTASLVAAVNGANSASGSTTITLAAGIYVPTSALTFSNTTGTIRLVGPSSGVGTANLEGSSVLPVPSDFIDVAKGASLDLDNVEVSYGGGSGGYPAINDYGSATLEDTALTGNTGFGLMIQRGATATVVDSTIGDGLDFGIIDQGTANLVNATVALNANGGIDNASGTLSLTNSVVADNTAGGNVNCTAPATTVDHSLDSDGSCGVSPPLSDVDPQLAASFDAPIRDGGTTPVYPLMPGSPALGAGDEAKCPASDQRGLPASDPCDVGAYQSGTDASPPNPAEVAPAPAAATGATGVSPAAPSAIVSYRRVSGRGTLANGRRGAITFTISVQRGRHTGTFDYHDPARDLRLRAVSIASVDINGSRLTATIKGRAVDVTNGRKMTFTAVLDCGRRAQTIAVHLSSGYTHGGRLRQPSVRLLRS